MIINLALCCGVLGAAPIASVPFSLLSAKRLIFVAKILKNLVRCGARIVGDEDDGRADADCLRGRAAWRG